MDDRFRIPGTTIRFGFDPIMGLVPGGGDTVGAAIGAYSLWRLRGLGLPATLLVRMTGNLLVDWSVGTIPLLGDLFDAGFKAHRRNARLLRRYLDSP
jgi:hypothetical protein